MADLDQSYVNEQIQAQPATGSLAGGYFGASPDYYSADLSAEISYDTHALKAGLFNAAGSVTINQVHVLADRRTGAWNVAMPNSGFTITQTLFFDGNGVLQLQITKQGAATNAGCCASGAGTTFPAAGGQPGPISATTPYQ